MTFYDAVTYAGLLLIGLALGRYGRQSWRYREPRRAELAARANDEAMERLIDLPHFRQQEQQQP